MNPEQNTTTEPESVSHYLMETILNSDPFSSPATRTYTKLMSLTSSLNIEVQREMKEQQKEKEKQDIIDKKFKELQTQLKDKKDYIQKISSEKEQTEKGLSDLKKKQEETEIFISKQREENNKKKVELVTREKVLNDYNKQVDILNGYSDKLKRLQSDRIKCDKDFFNVKRTFDINNIKIKELQTRTKSISETYKPFLEKKRKYTEDIQQCQQEYEKTKRLTEGDVDTLLQQIAALEQQIVLRKNDIKRIEAELALPDDLDADIDDPLF
ncbi:hypothetical protein QTN25_008171 [Entamoeba marina]